MEKILVIGNGGHAKSLLDVIEREKKYIISGMVVNTATEEVGEYPIIGNDDDLDSLFQCGIKNAAIGIGYLGKSNLRERMYVKLKKIGFDLPVLCDPSAIVAKHVTIGEGSFIGKGVIINSSVTIGKMCIINSGCIIEHDCIIDDFSHISVSSVLCGGVNIGKASFIGANATVVQMKTIGQRCIIGAGAVVKRNLEDASMVIKEQVIVDIGGGT